jgi:hypothetical protein
MGKTYDGITPDLAEWIAQQALFFVGTAPLAKDGHVNISPKGLDTLRVLGPRRVAWLDLTGSGAETIAHLRENGRIVIMFCAFAGAPKVVRLHGRGTVVTPAAKEWTALHAHFPEHIGTRSILDVAVTRVSDSCGFGVPTFGQPTQRIALPRWAQNKGPEGLPAYRREKNARSIDGLAGFEPDHEGHA